MKNSLTITFDISIIYRLSPYYIFARYFCLPALEKRNKMYSWYWLALPSWRFYIRRVYKQSHPRFGRYSDGYNKPARVKIFKINGYKYKIFPFLIKK